MSRIKHPNEIEWIDGDLPDVHTVPKGCCILAWFVNDVPLTQEEWERLHPSMKPISPDHNGKLRRIEICFPHEDDLNPLRWCDSSQHPIGYHEKVAHWSWLNKKESNENSSSET